MAADPKPDLAASLGHTTAATHPVTPPPPPAIDRAAVPPRLILEIVNFGAEIPPDAQAHIFEKFYRVQRLDRWQQGGTGLGLALVQKLTEHLGGTIQVASHTNQTRFTVQFPLHPVPSTLGA